MFLVVGLGNPGKKYEGTRHNVGFEVMDRLVKSGGGNWETLKKVDGEVAKFKVGDEVVWALKPQTFMNLSGESVRKFLDFYKPNDKVIILLVHDEVDVDLGKLKIHASRGYGGHHGVESVMKMMEGASSEFGIELVRFRVGVGRPGDTFKSAEEMKQAAADTDEFCARQSLEDWVLGKFSVQERAVIDEVIGKTVDAVSVCVKEGIEKAMNRFNG